AGPRRQPRGGERPPRQGRQPLGSEGVQDIADSLIVAPQRLANHACGLAPSTGQEDLAATQHKGIGRAQPLLQSLLFALGQGTNVNGFSHVQEYTTLPTTLLAIALQRVAIA